MTTTPENLVERLISAKAVFDDGDPDWLAIEEGIISIQAQAAEIAHLKDILTRLRDFDGWDGTFHAGHALDAKNDGRAALKPEAGR